MTFYGFRVVESPNLPPGTALVVSDDVLETLRVKTAQTFASFAEDLGPAFRAMSVAGMTAAESARSLAEAYRDSEWESEWWHGGERRGWWDE